MLVTFESMADPSAQVQVRTPRLIKATGFDLAIKRPLSLSSTTVESIAPVDLSKAVKAGDATFYIIGSGKTAMDAVSFIHAQSPQASITMVAGSGMMFINRDRAFPRDRLSRYMGGLPLYSMMMKYALRWDGTNHASLYREMLRRADMISPVPNPAACQLGLLGTEEMARITSALSACIKGRLADIVDSDGMPTLHMQDGRTIPIAAVASGQRVVVVNCTDNLRELDTELTFIKGARLV
ncbi:MAG: hypothetical protein AAGC55_33840, partial [Myxococcota bacterium]